jgi:hypothetical protein
VTVAHETAHDVGPHATKADHSELHDGVPPAVV